MSKNFVVIGDGTECRKCGKATQLREKKFIGQKELNAAYYYNQWTYCVPCNAVYFEDYNRVWNENKKADGAKRYHEYRDFYLNSNAHLRSIQQESGDN